MAASPQQQPLSARQSLEQALEEYGLQSEGPQSTGVGLQQLGRKSLLDQDELIQAAQEERVRRFKLQKASKQQAAHAAEALLQAPAGLTVFAQKLLQFYKSNGIEWPTVTVEYKDVNVSMDALVGSAGVPTVGNVLPQAAKDLFRRKGAQELKILKDVNGVLKPGTMTLLLGGPGSGKSTLLKVLSGRLKSNNFEIEGSVLYNKKPFSEFVVERTAAYVDQHDRHLPVLTVAETLEFAHACAGKRPDFVSKQELKEVYVRTMTGGGTGGPLPVLKSANDLSTIKPSSDSITGRLGQEVSTHSLGSSSDRSQPQGQDAIMSTSGFVHAQGEQDLLRGELAELLKLPGSSFKVELVMRLLGLTHARDTMIGSAMVRGVSGGERKRVTSGEMLVGNQRVLCMDEISTGLDSAILYSIIRFLKQSVSALHSTALISLLQPPPEVMGLFDDIIVLTEGRVIYHGPVAEVQQHFQSIGFDLPPRIDVPSWLVEICTPSGQWRYASNKLKTIWSKEHGGSRQMAALKAAAPEQQPKEEQQAQAPGGLAADAAEQPPVDATGKQVLLRSVEEMADAFWKESKMGRALLQEVQAGAELQPTDLNPRSLVMQRYALGVRDALVLALKRQWTFFLRNKAFIVFRLMQMVVMGLIVGSLFFNVPPDRTGVRTLLGASFICLMFLAFGSAPELGLLMMNRSVWYKHRDNYFLPTYAELSSMALVRAANTVYESVVFSSIVYWMIGYSRDAGAYFTYLLIMFCTSLSMSGLFRFIGSIAATPVHAQAFGSLGILALILTSGFAIIRPSIPGWWIWIYWLSPFSYSLRAIVVNEMTNERWSMKAPGNSYGLTMGEEGLHTFGFYTERYWIWVGVAYVLAFTFLMNYFSYLALKFYSGQQPRASLPDEREILKRRLKAEERKQNTSVALTVLDSGRPGSKTDKTRSAQSAWEAGAGGGNFEPITLVVKNLRYFVPNPSYTGKRAHGAGRGSSTASSRRSSSAAAPSTAATGDVQAHPTAAADLQSVDSADSGSPTAAAGVTVRVSVAGGISQTGGGAAEEVPQELELLKGINAFAVPSNLVALMGGSGAGKTTLMDCIAGRKTVGRITGDILVNGLPKQQATWAKQIGYVEQMDIHSSNTTVEEALWFSGRLRLPPSVTDAQVRQRVDEVLAQVDMTERFADLVGTPGISGLPTEARKRLTIAVELMANAPVLFMDEPTSGFDARAAAIVMSVVRAVACAGHTVMVTIHQPSINIFEGFDTLLLLQRGGYTSYFGPLGVHSKALVDYLESVPGTTKLPAGYNPATWMLEVTGGATATLIPANSSVFWPDHYLGSQLALENAQQADLLVQQGQAAAAAGQGTISPLAAALQHHAGGSYAQPFYRQVLECTSKALGSYWKSPAYNLLRLLMTAACALVYGTMYYKVGSVPSPAAIGSVQNVMGVLFSGANFLGNINLMSGMPVFSAERVVFYRERAAMMYDPLALGIATILAELPYVIAQATLFVPIVYFMVDFRHDAASFFFYYLMNIGSLMMFTSFGFFLVCATPMVELAQLFSGALNFLFNIFNGFTIVRSSIPSGWQWANRVVPPTWIIYGLAASQMGDNLTPITGPGLPPGSTVSSYLQHVYGYEYDFRWWALLIVASYTVGFTVLAVVFLKYVSFLKR